MIIRGIRRSARRPPLPCLPCRPIPSCSYGLITPQTSAAAFAGFSGNTPAGAARVLSWSGVSLLDATPEEGAAWIEAKIAAFDSVPAPPLSLFDMATGPAPTGSEPETDEDCL